MNITFDSDTHSRTLLFGYQIDQRAQQIVEEFPLNSPLPSQVQYNAVVDGWCLAEL